MAAAILGEIERLAVKYDPLFSAVDLLEDRLDAEPSEPEEPEEGESEAEKPAEETN